MTKLSTLCLTLALGCCAAIAAPPLTRSVPHGQSQPRPQRQTSRVFNPFSVRSDRPSKRVNLSNSMPTKLSGTSSRAKVAPMKAGASGSTIYSVVTYSRGAAPKGACEVFLDATVNHLADITLQSYGNAQDFGALFVRDGKMHVYTTEWDEYWGMADFMGNYYYEVDLATDDVKVTKLSDLASVFTVSAYNPDEDKIYGYLSTETAAWYGWAPGADPLDFHLVGTIPNNDFPEGNFALAALTYNQVSGKYVGIYNAASGAGVYEMDPATGKLTKIATMQNPTRYTTGFCYSPLDGGYVFVQAADGENSIQLLDEKTFKTISMTDYGYDIQFAPFYCPDQLKFPDSAPKQAELLSVMFPDGALSGSLSFRMSNENYGGNPVLGNINWILDIDGKEYKRGSAAAGSEFTISIEGLTEGEHTFILRPSIAGIFGREVSETVYVGNDTPVAPTDVKLSDSTITWQPSTQGVHNGYVNAEAVTYNVYVNGGMVATGIKSTECSPHLASDKPLDFYTAAVEAVFDGKISEQAFSNDIVYGQPLNVPYSYLPTPKESQLFTVLNNNNDAKTLEYYGEFKDGIVGEFSGYIYKYNSREDADDWLFLPVTNFADAAKVYTFSASIFGTNARYAESYEVLLCTSTDGTDASIVKTIVPERVASTFARGTSTIENMSETFYFTVPKAGTYYVAVHVTSPKDLYNLYLTNFAVSSSDAISSAGPGLPTGLSATAGAMGALEAEVSFTMPTASVAGTAYGDDKVLSASIQAEGCETVKVTGKPGETITTKVTTKQGENTITVTVADGDNVGAPDSIDVYTGVVAPGTVRNLESSVSADDMTMTLTWEAPESGDLDNGYVAPTGINYYLCERKTVDGQTGWFVTSPIGTDVYTYSYTVPEGTPLMAAHLGIVAENAAGLAEDFVNVSAMIGKPLEIPFENNYSAGDFVQPILTFDSSASFYVDDPGVLFSQYSTPDKRAALFTQSFYAIQDGGIMLPKFSTLGMQHAAFEINTFGGSCKSFAVYAKAPGMDQPQLIKEYAGEDFTESGPVKERVELPAAFQNQSWVEITLRYSTTGYTQSFIIYGFRYVDNIPHDFAMLKIAGSSIARIGEENVFTAQAMNFGYESDIFPGAEWSLKNASGEELAHVVVPKGTEPVEADGIVENRISFTPNADNLGDITLTFTLNADGGKDNNNTASYTFTVEKGIEPVVTDLHSTEASYDKVALAWTAPEPAPVIESFEDETPFTLDDESEMIAQFRRHDGDGETVWGLNDEGYGSQPWANEPMSFMVWSQEAIGEILDNKNLSIEANSGDKFLVAFCPAPEEDGGKAGAADDWLISPKVDGGSSLSFSARAFSYAYGAETIEVMYSTGSDKPEDFKVLSTVELKGAEDEHPMWQQYSFELPADAKYFALHYVSHDIFGIMLDDIAYAPEGETVKVTGFEVYRNGILATTVADSACEDTDVQPDTQYTYTVVPTLSNGSKGLVSNTLVIRTTGVNGIDGNAEAVYAAHGQIIVKGFEGKSVAIVSADGKTIFATSSAASVEQHAVESGIYLVRAADSTRKLIVK